MLSWNCTTASFPIVQKLHILNNLKKEELDIARPCPIEIQSPCFLGSSSPWFPTLCTSLGAREMRGLLACWNDELIHVDSTGLEKGHWTTTTTLPSCYVKIAVENCHWTCECFPLNMMDLSRVMYTFTRGYRSSYHPKRDVGLSENRSFLGIPLSIVARCR